MNSGVRDTAVIVQPVAKKQGAAIMRHRIGGTVCRPRSCADDVYHRRRTALLRSGMASRGLVPRRVEDVGCSRGPASNLSPTRGSAAAVMVGS
jgi:hypothetical protein